MFWDTLIDVALALFSGRSELASAALTNPPVLLILFALTLLSIAVATAKNQHYGWTMASLAGAGVLALTFYSQQTSSFDLHSGRVFIGSDFAGAAGTVQKISFDTCQQLCAGDSQCAAFTYDRTTERCYPKAVITTMHVFASAISGIKRARPGAAAAH